MAYIESMLGGDTMTDNPSTALPVIYVRGDNYQIGHTMGTTFRNLIQKAVEEDQVLHGSLLPFNKTESGRCAYDELLSTARRLYPQYVEEIQGIADGAQVEFYQLILKHFATELSTIQDTKLPQPLHDGCTDVLLNNPQQSFLVHSEDGSPELRRYGYLVNAHVLPSSKNGFREESFTGFCYPGTLPGNTMGFNKYGLVHSLNIMIQRDINLKGIGRRFLNRALLAAEDIDDVIKISELDPGVATGFNMNFAQAQRDGTIQMSSVEMAGATSGTKVNRLDINGFFYHCNEYQRMDNVGLPEASTCAREVRIAELTRNYPPQTLSHLLRIMGDTQNKDFPIFRDGAPPDELATMAIGAFDMRAGKMFMFSDNPVTGDPIATFNIPHWNDSMST